MYANKQNQCMQLNIQNETNTLKSVVLGQANSMELVPSYEETYDAKSRESVAKNIYPIEQDVIAEMNAFEKVLQKHNVEVFRPEIITHYNQVFARDVAFVIEDKLIISNIIPDRAHEIKAYQSIFNSISSEKIIQSPEKVHIEGGDVILYNNFIFIGTYKKNDYALYKTARTNHFGVDFIKELFPEKQVIDFCLKKDDNNPYEGILHLDCAFQPIGNDKAIIYKDGFNNNDEYEMLVEIFGKENLFEVTQQEMYYMTPNVFSIAPNVVVIEQNFTRLAQQLNDWNIQAEKIPYYEISKMGGLLRCSTLPLIRE